MGLRIRRSIVESHGAACGLLTTLREARDFVSHYLPTTRHATRLCLEIALKLLTALTTTSGRLSYECWAGDSRSGSKVASRWIG